MQEFHFNKQTENYHECCQPLEQVSQGYSILGDIQILTGYSPGQFALADPALSNAWVGLDDLRRSLPTSTVLWLCEPYEVVLNAEIWSELFRPLDHILWLNDDLLFIFFFSQLPNKFGYLSLWVSLLHTDWCSALYSQF